jgi:CheY-like chemotaxis protein
MKTVLIIDDEAEFRTLLAEVLTSQGWRVLQADSGAGGLEMARTHQPPVIVCDLRMPGGNGFQLCRLIRENPNLRETRILVVSGRQLKATARGQSRRQRLPVQTARHGGVAKSTGTS